MARSARRVHHRARRPPSTPTTRSAIAAAPASARCGCGSTTPSTPGPPSPAAGCGGPAGRWRRTPSATPTATSCSGRPRPPTAPASSTRRSRWPTEALALGRRLPSTDLEAEALQTTGRILIDQGQIDEGMGHLDEAMLFAVEGRLGPFATGKVYCSLIGACEDVGDYNRAAEWTEATQRWAEAHPFAIFPGVCRVHRAIILKRSGALEEAEQEAARACDELRGSHVPNSAAALRRGRRHPPAPRRPRGGRGGLRPVPGGRRRTLRRAGAPAPRPGAEPGGDGDRHQLRGEPGQPARPGRRAPGPGPGRAGGRRHRRRRTGPRRAGQHGRADGHPRAARRRALDPRPGAAGRGRPGRAGHAAGGGGGVASPGRARTRRRPPARCVGQAQRLAGDEAGATASFEAAVALFDQIGARLESRLVLDDTKRELPAGLTEREVEVLRLIAAGMTNNEIAAELFLSAKTVSRHLSNIFTKIGVSTRAGGHRLRLRARSTARRHWRRCCGHACASMSRAKGNGRCRSPASATPLGLIMIRCEFWRRSTVDGPGSCGRGASGGPCRRNRHAEAKRHPTQGPIVAGTIGHIMSGFADFLDDVA